MTGTSFVLELVPLTVRDENEFEPHPQNEVWYLLGVLFKISGDHPGHFYMGVPPPGGVTLHVQ